MVMPINFTPFVEGDAISHTSMNTTFSTLETGVNDLDGSDVERHGLTHDHLPDMSHGEASGMFANGYSATSSSANALVGISEKYRNSLPYVDTVDFPYDYQAFNGLAPNPPYGPPGIFIENPESGWRILATANVAADAALIQFGNPAQAYSLTDERLRGILVRGSVEFTNGDVTTFDRCGLIAIAFQTEDGGRHVLERTVRFNATTACRAGDMVTSTVITQADLDNVVGTPKISEVMIVIARGRRNTNAIGAVDAGIWVRSYNITALPLMAAELTL
jgi:hypothetical protein